jgi:hypothetical protein
MRVYHFLSREFGMKDLRERRLKIATFEDVNDPFELLPICAGADERRRFQNARADMAKLIGLLCFSRDWSSPVQWAHYAEAHKGVCLGFDVPDEALTSVRYRRRRFRANWLAMNGTQTERVAELKRWFSTKFVHWQYEAEERAFLMLSNYTAEEGRYFVPFDQELRLAEVIVGHRSKVTRSDIAGVLQEDTSRVEVFKARLAFQSYRVVRQNMASMWV